MKNKICFFLFLLTFFQITIAQNERSVGNIKKERKIALVIGNTNYDNNIGRLTNPVNDATDIANALDRLGFTLVGGRTQLDVNRKQMLQLIREFGQQIKEGGIGFFYFSGHGVQVNKENYIIPITDALQYEDDAETEAIKVDMVAKEMDLAGNRLNILVLDACRNNGLQKRTRNADKGLTEPNRKPEGTFIAFSAGDGQTASDGTGRNGLFTQELLKNLETPNVRLDDIFRTTRNEVKKLSDNRQIPVLFDSTSQAFILKNTDTATNGENQFWEAIKNSTDPKDFRLYMEKYPNGIYQNLADLKIKQLNKAKKNSPNEVGFDKDKVTSSYFWGTWKYDGFENGSHAEEYWEFKENGTAIFKTTDRPLGNEKWSFSDNILYETHSTGEIVKSKIDIIDRDNFIVTVLTYSENPNYVNVKRLYTRQK